MSFSNTVTAVSKREDFPYALIPAFPSRAFRHSSIFVRTDRGISKPEDLRGKIVGLPHWGLTIGHMLAGLRDAGRPLQIPGRPPFEKLRRVIFIAPAPLKS